TSSPRLAPPWRRTVPEQPSDEPRNRRSPMTTLNIRPMTVADLALVLTWAEAEGWCPGNHDAPCFHAADPTGFLLGEVDGEPVGCIATVAYDQSFGSLGMYIVRPEFRGRGIGLAIWSAGMAYLG